MRNYDGVYKCQAARDAIERRGFVCAYTTRYSDKSCPREVMSAGDSGWAIRRAIKAWAKSNAVDDYVIFRATDYLKDLHGATYEVFVRPAAQPEDSP